MPHLEWSDQGGMAQRMEADTGGAAALPAIGRAAKRDVGRGGGVHQLHDPGGAGRERDRGPPIQAGARSGDGKAGAVLHGLREEPLRENAGAVKTVVAPRRPEFGSATVETWTQFDLRGRGGLDFDENTAAGDWISGWI